MWFCQRQLQNDRGQRKLDSPQRRERKKTSFHDKQSFMFDRFGKQLFVKLSMSEIILKSFFFHQLFFNSHASLNLNATHNLPDNCLSTSMTNFSCNSTESFPISWSLVCRKSRFTFYEKLNFFRSKGKRFKILKAMKTTMTTSPQIYSHIIWHKRIAFIDIVNGGGIPAFRELLRWKILHFPFLLCATSDAFHRRTLFLLAMISIVKHLFNSPWEGVTPQHSQLLVDGSVSELWLNQRLYPETRSLTFSGHISLSKWAFSVFPQRDMFVAVINNSIFPSLHSNDWLRMEISFAACEFSLNCHGFLWCSLSRFVSPHKVRMKYRRARNVNWLCKQQSTSSCAAFNVNLMRVMLGMRSKRHKSLESLGNLLGNFTSHHTLLK